MEPKEEHIRDNGKADDEGSDGSGSDELQTGEEELMRRAVEALESIAFNLSELRQHIVPKKRRLGELLGKAISPPRVLK
jgi:hypothetical protein